MLLFAKAKCSQLNVIMEVLKIFEEVSCLKVNIDKSIAMVSKSVSRQKRQRLASLCTISFASNLGKYLGFPMVQGRLKKSDFLFLVEKKKSRSSS